MMHDLDGLMHKAACEGLTDDERQRLNRWVNASPDHARELIEYMADNASIKVALQSLRVARAGESIDSPDEFFAGRDANAGPGGINSPRPHTADGRNQAGAPTHDVFALMAAKPQAARHPLGLPDRLTRHVPRFALVLTGLAALIGVAVWLVYPALAPGGSPPDERRMATAPGPVDRGGAPSGPALAGEDGWTYSVNTERSPRMGNLPSGSGYARYSFSHRGHGTVLIEGPAIWEMLDGDAIRLFEGRLVAKANPAADQPVVVLIDNTKITLHDAEFGVYRKSMEQTSLIVFEGAIDIAPMREQGRPALPATRIEAGQTGVLDPQRATVDRLAPMTPNDLASYTRYDADVLHRPAATSETVRYLGYAPASLEPGYLENSSRAHLIYESSGVCVDHRDLLTDPRDLVFLDPDATDSTLDSFILHFDPEGDGDQGPAHLRGSVLFKHPIRAVLVSGTSIRDSDGLFQNKQTAYPRQSLAPSGPGAAHPGWSIEPTQSDRLTVSQDQRILHFQFDAADDIDQVRILVDAAQ